MQEPSSSAGQPNEESIFDDQDLAQGDYDKHVRQARNAIFIVAAIQFVFGLYTAYQLSGNVARFTLVLMSLIALVFFLLGLWTKKKPYSAILSALIFYGSLLLLDLILSPATAIKGFLIKIFIIVYLVKGLGSAREAQRWKETLGR